jgi:DNA polymerase-3 subunit gamma/tau
MGKKHQVLARRYRPQQFTDVIGQASVLTTLKNALRFDQAAHAYLFCGSRGVGKTTLARLFAKALNCSNRSPELEPCNQCPSCLEITAGQSLDVMEIDGASNRGIDDIRQINETVGYAPSHGKYKIYIIDEVHMLTKEAFNALLKTLEEPPERAKFFFATTEPHKVLPTIISRCQRFDLLRINTEQISQKLGQIAADLKREADPEALHLIASFADGSLRDAESLFDQILCFSSSAIQADTVRGALGLVPQEHFSALDLAFSECRLAYSFELVEHLFHTGKDLAHFLEQLIEHYRRLCLFKTVGETSIPPHFRNFYAKSSPLYTQAQCLYILDLLISAEQTMQKSPFPRVTLESTLLHLIRSKNRIPIEAIVRRLSELEQTIQALNPSEELPRREEPAQNIPSPTPPTSAPLVKEPPPPTIEQALPVESPPSPISLPPLLPKESSSKPPASSPQLLDISSTVQREPAPQQTPFSQKHASHYETMIRFAAVELEGTIKN